MIMRKTGLSLLLAGISLCANTAWAAMPGKAADPFAAVEGIWMTEDRDGAVELYACGDALCGKFYWLKPGPVDDPTADLDDKNPNPQLRNRPLCGMQFMGGFTPGDDGWLDGGWIYSPRHGAKFSSAIKPQSHDAIELRGYLFLPFLGSSQTWTRAAAVKPCQPDDRSAGITNQPARRYN